MGIIDNIRKSLSSTKFNGRHWVASQRSRTSQDVSNEPMLFGSFHVQSPPDHVQDWRLLDLSSQTLSRINPADLIEIMSDVSPEVSRALWDFLRFCNPGFDCTVTRPGSDEQDKRGKDAIEAMLKTLSDNYGSINVVFGRLFLGAFIRGAFSAELVLDENGRDFADLATPDPYSIRFRKVNDPIRGKIFEPGQWQGGRFVSLDIETFDYIPIDPFPGNPYGRSPVQPAVFTALFLVGLLHDLRRVIAQQGYPRIDLSINMEKLIEHMPADAKSDPEAAEQWVNAIITEVQSVYAKLEPDDAYIHTDVVEVNRPVGTVDASSLGAIDGLIKALERMVTRGLKTMPLMMGTDEGNSETHANRQWEIHAASIKSIQSLCAEMLGRLFTLALQAQGINAQVKFEFSQIRASERLRDAQAEAMEIANATNKYNQGWISQDEASEEITGSPAVERVPLVSNSSMPDFIQDDGDSRYVDIVNQAQQLAADRLAKYQANGAH